jgi:hypothetical protein
MNVDPSDKLEVSRPVRAVLVACWVAAVLIGAVKAAAALGRAPNRPLIFDFHVFMIAGREAWAGHLASAYDPATMMQLQHQAGGRDWFMPWSYPPLFGLVMAPFSQLPIILAFGLFVLGAFALFLFGLRRIRPQSAWLVLAALAPCTIVNLASGQNGLLTGGLTALAVAAFVRKRPGQGGLAIGALAYKPHMAVAWPVLLAARGRWTMAAIAGGVAATLTGLSYLAVGPEPFRAFLSSGAESSRYMAGGFYHLNRMTSLYASALSLGLPSGAALALHIGGALTAIGGLVWVGRRLPEAAQAGLAIMSTVFISPYFYDYDLPLFGVGLALVLPELMARASPQRMTVLLAAVAVAQVMGLAVSGLPFQPSLGGPLLLAIFGVTLQTLVQTRRGNLPLVAAPEDSGAPAPSARHLDAA